MVAAKSGPTFALEELGDQRFSQEQNLKTKYLLLSLLLLGCVQGKANNNSQLRQETDDRETERSAALLDESAKIDEYMNQKLADARSAANPTNLPWDNAMTAALIQEFAKRTAVAEHGTGLGFAFGNVSLEISKLTKAEFDIIHMLDANKNEILPIKFSESRYTDNPIGIISGKFPSHKTRLTADHSLSPVVRLGTVLIGLDKIGHFLEEGWWYYQAESRGLLHGFDERWTLGQFMEGDDVVPVEVRSRYEKIYGTFCSVCVVGGGFGFFGAKSTGVISYGDIYANESGYQFFSDLAADPAGYQFKILSFTVDKWNEQNSPSKLVPGLQSRD